MHASWSHAEGSNTTTVGRWSHAEGDNAVSVGGNSHAEGNGTTTYGTGSHAEGSGTETYGWYSHAEGFFAISTGSYSHAEGDRTTTVGDFSHAEGRNTTTLNNYTHAEGYFTIANGYGSHAEGYYTTAIGLYSHTEGIDTIAQGSGSHAGGYYTKATADHQTVFGSYNATDASAKFLIGDGDSEGTRSNTFVAYENQVGINGAPSESVALHVHHKSHTAHSPGGFMFPVVTYNERTSLNKYPGLTVYQTGSFTTTKTFRYCIFGTNICFTVIIPGITVPEGVYTVQPSGSSLEWVNK